MRGYDNVHRSKRYCFLVLSLSFFCVCVCVCFFLSSFFPFFIAVFSFFLFLFSVFCFLKTTCFSFSVIRRRSCSCSCRDSLTAAPHTSESLAHFCNGHLRSFFFVSAFCLPFCLMLLNQIFSSAVSLFSCSVFLLVLVWFSVSPFLSLIHI